MGASSSSVCKAIIGIMAPVLSSLVDHSDSDSAVPPALRALLCVIDCFLYIAALQPCSTMKRSLLDLVKAQDVSGRIALVRIDANVPMEGEGITDDTRLRESLPTIRLLCTSRAKILLCRYAKKKNSIIPCVLEAACPLCWSSANVARFLAQPPGAAEGG